MPIKFCLVKAMVFPVVMYACESWTLRKAEHWSIDAFELCCWRRLLRVPCTARRSNQSILKEISPGCSLEGLMLNLKLQYFGHLTRRVIHWKRPWCWGGIEGRRRRGRQRMRCWMALPTRWTWVWVDFGSWQWTGRPGVLQFMGSKRVRRNWVTELNWTECIIQDFNYSLIEQWKCRVEKWHKDFFCASSWENCTDFDGVLWFIVIYCDLKTTDINTSLEI